MITLNTHNEIDVLTSPIVGVWRIDLLHIQSNNLYPILCQVQEYNTYVTIIFDIDNDYENGEYNYDIYCEDVLIESGIASFDNKTEVIKKVYNKDIIRKVYER